MSRGSIWLLAGATLTVYAAAGAAFAEEAEEKATPPFAGPHIFMPGPHGETRVYAMKNFGADRADKLRTLLQIRPEQEPALAAYLDALNPPRTRRSVVKSGETTLTRLDAMEKLLDADREAGKARIAATRTFYAALDARQKKVFDEMPNLVMSAAWTLPLPPMPLVPPSLPIAHSLAIPAFEGAFDEVFDLEADSPGV